MIVALAVWCAALVASWVPEGGEADHPVAAHLAAVARSVWGP